MDDVRLVFTASQSWFGRLIRWFTKSKTSHVFIEFPVWDRRMVVESTVGGTRMVLATKARHGVVAEYKLNVETKPSLIKLMPYLGTPYDYSGLLLLAWARIALSWAKAKVKQPLWGTKAVKCSELVAVFINELGLLQEDWVFEFISPEDIRTYVSKHEDKFERVLNA